MILRRKYKVLLLCGVGLALLLAVGLGFEVMRVPPASPSLTTATFES
jgi:hypothetical protein